MKKTVSKIICCAASLMLAASMMSACENTEESGAKQLLISALDSEVSTFRNTLSLIGNKSSKEKMGGKVKVSVDPGEYLDKLADKDMKEISLSAEEKVKGGVLGTGLSFGYDGEKLADIDTVIDSDSKNTYIRINELSDKYIKTSISDDEADSFLSGIKSLADIDFVKPQGGEFVNDVLDNAVGAFKSVDIGGIVKDVDSVVDAVSKALPETENSGEKTVKKNGIEVIFKTEKFSMSDNNVDEKCTNAVKQALLKSENIKAVVSEVTDYEELVNNMFASDATEEGIDDALAPLAGDDVVFYYYNDKLCGVGIDNKNYFISSDTDDGYMFVLKTNYQNDYKSEVVLTAIPDGEKLDISFSASFDDNTNVSVLSGNDLALKINDFEIVNKDIGTYNAQVEAGMYVPTADGGKAKCVVKSKSEGDDRAQTETGEIVVEENKTSQNLLSYQLSVEQTDASDIKIPDDSECIVNDDDIAKLFTGDNLYSWLDKISKAIGIDISEKLDEMVSSFSEIYDDQLNEDIDNDYDDDPLYDLMDNYGIDYWDYYSDDYTEFYMDKFLSDAKKVYPAEKMDALKEQIEEEYQYYLSDTPNLDALYDDYQIDYWDYYDDDLVNFDMDKFLADAKKVYPADKMDELKKEIEDVISEYE